MQNVFPAAYQAFGAGLAGLRVDAIDHPTEKGGVMMDNEECKEEQTETENTAQNEAERLLAQQLTEGEPAERDPAEEAVKRLPPKWEIRIQTRHDPVVEETAIYRTFAKEVDGRYDNRVKPDDKGE